MTALRKPDLIGLEDCLATEANAPVKSEFLAGAVHATPSAGEAMFLSARLVLFRKRLFSALSASRRAELVKESRKEFAGEKGTAASVASSMARSRREAFSPARHRINAGLQTPAGRNSHFPEFLPNSRLTCVFR